MVGTFPTEVALIMKKIDALFHTPLGIHAHNDCGMAVANSVSAVEKWRAGTSQGTYIGFGERCGQRQPVHDNRQSRRQA